MEPSTLPVSEARFVLAPPWQSLSFPRTEARKHSRRGQQRLLKAMALPSKSKAKYHTY